MSAALLPLQAAAFAVMTASPGVGYDVFDNVPPGTDGPYIEIGDDTSIDWGTKGGIGEEVTFTLHCWSTRRTVTDGVVRGRAECKRMAGAVYQLFHMRPFPVDGFTMADVRHEFTQIVQDPDGRSCQAVVRFRALLEAQS